MCIIFFLKQKTAYELRISDWSSDVCSSDLGHSHGMLGHDHKRPLDILAEARQQLARYPGIRLVNERADSISGEIDDFSVLSDDGESLGVRKSVVAGKRVSVRVDLSGRRIIKKKQNKKPPTTNVYKVT